MDKHKIGKSASLFAVYAGLGFSLVMALVRALGWDISTSRILLSACGASLFVTGMTLSKRARLATLFGGLGTVLLFALTQGISPLTEAFFAVTGEGDANLTPIACLACAILTLVLYGSGQLTERSYPAIFFTAATLIGAQIIGGTTDVVYTTVSLLLCVCLFSMERTRAQLYRVLPAALIICLVSMLFVPPAGTVWDRAQEFAEKVRKLFEDYTAFDDARQTYTLYTDGFQPLGDALGGPAEPKDNEIMTVETDQTLLLRGSIRRTYTGTAWTEPAVNSRFLYLDPTSISVRNSVFDSDTLSGIGDISPLEQTSVSVTMLSDGISTLFVPHRLQSLSVSYDTPAYYSSSGEVFITRGVQEGDSYSFTALVQTDGSENLADLLERAKEQGDENYSAVVKNYTELPQGIDNKVYALAEKITKDCATPYEKACAIQDWLFENCTYTLDMDYTPNGKDFVSYFLLKQKKGYCTYFASAFAVLCRMAGLPTRYIEGYLCSPSEDGACVVTSRNAHAWVEVYFEGAGWITFNPTPGDETENGEGDDAAASSDDEEGEGEEDAPPEEESPEEEQQENEEEEEPQEQPEETPLPEDGEGSANFLWLLWLLLLLPVGYVYARYRLSDPQMLGKCRAEDRERLLAWYEDALLSLAILGMQKEGSESPVQHARRIAEGNRFADLAQEVENVVYGERNTSQSALRQAKNCCEKLRKRMNGKQKMTYIAKRIAKGRVLPWIFQNCRTF